MMQQHVQHVGQRRVGRHREQGFVQHRGPGRAFGARRLGAQVGQDACRHGVDGEDVIHQPGSDGAARHAVKTRVL
ncbi:hypothetical protein RZS08_16470, partial [Arthrospira platensis SPKY1]|nr:hypothetical protein [Arthrospira platensis SPKY1]